MRRRKGNSPLAGGTKASAGQVERRGCAARSDAQARLALPGRAGELGRARVIGPGLRRCVGWASSCGLGRREFGSWADSRVRARWALGLG